MILTPDIVFNTIEEVTGVTRDELKSKSRLQRIAHARFLLNYFMRLYCDMTLLEIGRETYSMDHSSVLHSIKKVREAVENPRLGYDKIVEWHRELSPKFMGMRRHYRDYTGAKRKDVKWIRG